MSHDERLLEAMRLARELLKLVAEDIARPQLVTLQQMAGWVHRTKGALEHYIWRSNAACRLRACVAAAGGRPCGSGARPDRGWNRPSASTCPNESRMSTGTGDKPCPPARSSPPR